MFLSNKHWAKSFLSTYQSNEVCALLGVSWRHLETDIIRHLLGVLAIIKAQVWCKYEPYLTYLGYHAYINDALRPSSNTSNIFTSHSVE